VSPSTPLEDSIGSGVGEWIGAAARLLSIAAANVGGRHRAGRPPRPGLEELPAEANFGLPGGDGEPGLTPLGTIGAVFAVLGRLGSGWPVQAGRALIEYFRCRQAVAVVFSWRLHRATWWLRRWP
jgi:hypothetical protein